MQSLSEEHRKMTSLFVHQLETGMLKDSADVAIHTVRLLRHAALSSWGNETDVHSNGMERAVATVSAITSALLDAGPLHSCIEGVSNEVSSAVRRANSRSELSSFLTALVSEVGNTRTALSDHAVSAIAGGSPTRCVAILGVHMEGGPSEEAVSEAADDMDKLHVIVIGVRPDEGAAANAMVVRLREVDGVTAEAVNLSRLGAVFQAQRVHAVLLDVLAVDGSDGVIAPCGAAIVAATARIAAVRTFALTAKYGILPSGSRSLRALRLATEHPGPVLPYDLARGTKHDIKVLNPYTDFVAMHRIDVLITSSGVQ